MYQFPCLYVNTAKPSCPFVTGDLNFNISSMSSGDVRATTLTILRYSKESSPHSFSTVFTNENGTMQYRLNTSVKKKTRYNLDNIDSPEWVTLSDPEQTFTEGGTLDVHCRILVLNEESGYTNHLSMSRLIPKFNFSSEPRTAEMQFEQVYKVHDNPQAYNAEESEGTIREGRRIELATGHVIYQIRMRTVDARRSRHEGIYQCSLERQYDRTVYITTARLYERDSLFPSQRAPLPLLTSCHKQDPGTPSHQVILNEGQDSCLRCQGFGDPLPNVNFYKDPDRLNDRLDTERIQNSNDYTLTHYINVLDGGVNETTLTFRSPGRAVVGTYMCRVQTDYVGEDFTRPRTRVCVRNRHNENDVWCP